MRLGFLALSTNERRPYFEQAAIQRNVSPIVLEKDFWVCWLLGILFESEFAGSLVFKGGTSLSKVFGVIERFSEVAKSLPWKWSEASGRRQRSSTRNTIGQPRSRHPTDFPAITRIQRRWQSTRPRAEPSANTTSATGLWNGRVSSLAVLGRTTTRRSPEPFASFRRPSGCLRCGVITRRCGTCISLSRPVSTTFLRSWPIWKNESTTLGADKSPLVRNVYSTF
jgi:Nucleotidyl transferase AbiEii toxin, Type IV TA system